MWTQGKIKLNNILAFVAARYKEREEWRDGMFQGRDFGRDVASPKLGSAQAIE